MRGLIPGTPSGPIPTPSLSAPDSSHGGSGAGPILRSGPHSPAIGRRVGFDYLVVGAGFAGSVLAERLAAGSGKRVLVVDRRPHIAGNAYDHYDDAGVLVHRYGPHIFHTNSPAVAEYLSRFTKWRPYEHRVLAQVGRKLVPMPINRTTLNLLYGLDLRDEAETEAYLASRAEPVEEIRTSEDVVISKVGRELYETFFRGYTRKQWGLDPSELDKSVTARVPTRTNTDDRYFGDSFQQMPLHGYTRMFENMLDHPNIKIMLNTDFREVRNEVAYDKLIFTGPVDEYFDYRYGQLPYRSLRFRHETVDQEQFQPVAVVNYPSEDVPYTRITEYKHLTGQRHARTSVTYEYPSAEGDPYYPVPRPENAELYRKYQALADATPDVAFVGRLATYRYYNMDQVVAQALATYARLAKSDQRVNGTAEAARAMSALARGLPTGQRVHMGK
ncbi:UDP-galactopyranose mutase [Arenibaculum pallidiluteum]|uniref:UDP-galactopyranose mutase n=1 Tax=Arenibaculum pallidiluteum TaxID=2812559 RepID=UPI001A959A74|nr:UDP-galactopyranose mutase [Arenibaculum pallidiluteum]